MSSSTLPRTTSPRIPLIYITPSAEVNSSSSDLLYDHSKESDSNESDSTDSDIDEREVVRPRYRPSLPNRSKSAPLPSDDDDSSEDERQVVQRHQPKLRQPAPSHLLSCHQPKMQKQKQQQQLRSRSDETRTTSHHRHRRPIPPPLTHVQSNQSIAYFAYPVPLSIQPTCSFHPQYRRPLPMSSASEMVGYTFRRK